MRAVSESIFEKFNVLIYRAGRYPLCHRMRWGWHTTYGRRETLSHCVFRVGREVYPLCHQCSGGTHKYPLGEDIYLSDVGWKKTSFSPWGYVLPSKGQTNKQTNRQTDKQTDRQTNKKTNIFPKFIALDSVVTYWEFIALDSVVTYWEKE